MVAVQELIGRLGGWYSDLQGRDFIALASAAVALISLMLAVITLRRSLARDQRDSLFKAFESYLKIRELRAKAEAAGQYVPWFEYYRAAFDLQWSEFYIWREGALADKPYRVWLQLQFLAYQESDVPGIAPPISHRRVWETLLADRYFDRLDDFVDHMALAHSGQIDQALRRR